MSAVAARDRGILAAAIEAGRLVVDVFGLGSVVQKIEEYFGRRVCGALLLLIAITAFILCTNAVISYGIIPLVQFVRDVSSKSALALVQTFALGAIVGGAAAIVFGTVLRLYVRRFVLQAGGIVQEADELIKRADAATQRAQELIEETAGRQADVKRLQQKTREMMDEIDTAVDKG